MRLAACLIVDGTATNSAPEYELVAAILLRAVDDLCGVRLPGCKNDLDRRQLETNLRRAAQRWFEAERRTAGSFLWCCELLGLDPQAVRRNLKRLGDEPTAGLRTLPPSDEHFESAHEEAQVSTHGEGAR